MAKIIGSGLDTYLHREARERAMNLIGDANAKALRLVSEARAGAALSLQDADERTMRMAEERRRRALAQARLKASQTVARQSEEMIQKLWRAAEARLRAMEDAGERREIIRRLLADAAGPLGGGPLLIQVAAVDREGVAAALPEWLAELGASHGVTSLELDAESPSIWGGVVVRRTDVRRLADNSFNARLALIERQLRDQIYRRLSGGGGDASGGR
jgi:vacuolar-type H+-ATPase subunit E/Vma4